MKFFNKENGIKRTVALTLALVVLLSLVLSACDKDKNEGGATADSVATSIQDYVFPEGIVIGNTDISGMSYSEAYKVIEESNAMAVSDFTLKVTAEEKEFEYKKSDFQWSLGIEEALESAVDFLKSEDYKEDTSTGNTTLYSADISVDVKADSVESVVDGIAKEVDIAAVDSTFSVDGDTVNVSREKAGRQLDKEYLTEEIKEALPELATGSKKTATVKAIVNEVAPKYKFESLNGEIKLISTYSTWSTNTENGNNNMRVALEACNGSIINPGEVWSFNECTGNSNLTSLGYLPATVIVNGKFEEGIGGGLCQSSSTIYNAAILANMEIEERYCHQFQSSYVPAGRDATIDYPGLDLKLSNPTDYPMYMQCYMEGTQLTVNIYGWDDPSFDYIEIESYVHSATDEGYRASAQRVYYLDDEEVGREDLPNSWYDYPEKDEPETTKPKATKPAAKPKETKPKETKPKATQAPQTKPEATKPVETLPSDPVEVTTAPINTEATEATSKNDEQIETATVNY
ncbi:MAG: VanW family protein [Clostridia bacterium]|nr:VanW family protein [Clostridia bacterium]